MDLPRKTKYCLLGFMLSIILYFKYPKAPHEIGSDSFVVHGMAGTLQSYDYAPWLLNPASAYALYPFSYAPGMPFILSSLSELSGLSLELVILLFTIIITLVGVAGMFMFATEVKDQFEVKFFSAFLFAFTPAVAIYTIWRISTRGPFICLMPVLLWALSRTITARHKSKFFLLGFILLMILPTIHHFALFFPILLLALLGSMITVLALEHTDRESIYYRENVMITSGIILILIIFLFYLQVSSVDLYGPHMAFFKTWYVYGDRDSPFTTAINIVVYYGISLGILMLYAGIGLASIIEKVNKSRVEWALLFFILFFTLFLADRTYMTTFLAPLFIPLAALGMVSLLGKIEYRKGLFTVLAGTLLLIGAYYGDYATYKHFDSKIVEETNHHFHMDEEPYNTAIYLKHTIYEIDGPNAIHNDRRDKRRISAISGVQMLPLNGADVMVAYPEITNQVVIKKYSIFEMYLRHKDHVYYVDWENSTIHDYDNYSFINKGKWNDTKVIENLTEFRVSWAIVNTYFPEEYGLSSGPFLNKPSRFFASLSEGRYKLYENDYERVYFLFST